MFQERTEDNFYKNNNQEIRVMSGKPDNKTMENNICTNPQEQNTITTNSICLPK